MWREGIVVSASHTVRTDGDVAVSLPSGDSSRATVVGRDAATDLVVLRLDGTSATVAQRADADTARIGALVLAVGRPGRKITASFGIVSAVADDWRGAAGGRIDRVLRLDLSIYDGFSGGPLVDSNGAVIGINNSALARGTPTALPASTVDRVVDELLEARAHSPAVHRRRRTASRAQCGYRGTTQAFPRRRARRRFDRRWLAGRVGGDSDRRRVALGGRPAGPSSDGLARRALDSRRRRLVGARTPSWQHDRPDNGDSNGSRRARLERRRRSMTTMATISSAASLFRSAATSLADSLASAVVEVRNQNNGSGGAGLIWGGSGLVVTNAHCVPRGAAIEVGSAGRWRETRVVGSIRRMTSRCSRQGGPADRWTGGPVFARRRGYAPVNCCSRSDTHSACATRWRWAYCTTSRAIAEPVSRDGSWPTCDSLRATPAARSSTPTGRFVGINSMVVNGLGVAVPAELVQQFVDRVLAKRAA